MGTSNSFAALDSSAQLEDTATTPGGPDVATEVQLPVTTPPRPVVNKTQSSPLMTSQNSGTLEPGILDSLVIARARHQHTRPPDVGPSTSSQLQSKAMQAMRIASNRNWAELLDDHDNSNG